MFAFSGCARTPNPLRVKFADPMRMMAVPRTAQQHPLCVKVALVLSHTFRNLLPQGLQARCGDMPALGRGSRLRTGGGRVGTEIWDGLSRLGSRHR